MKTRNKLRGLVIGVLAVTAFVTAPRPAHATSGIIDVQGTRKLTETHYGTFWLNDDATLDCQGHYIYNDDQEPICGENFDQTCGIMASVATEIKIINCKVRNFDMGVYIQYASHVEAVSLDARYNSKGVVLYYVDNTYGGHFFKDGYYGYNDEEGFDVEFTSNLVFTGNNRFRYNDRDGLDCNSSLIKMYNATVTRNLLNGVELDSCNSSIISGTSSTYNGNTSGSLRSGISLDASDGVTLTNNTVNDNYRDGIRVADDSDNGTFTGNTGSGNDEHDAHETSDSNNNTWSSNTFGTTSGI